MTAEIVIRNGVLADGCGGAPRPADIAIEGDRITEVVGRSYEEMLTLLD